MVFNSIEKLPKKMSLNFFLKNIQVVTRSYFKWQGIPQLGEASAACFSYYFRKHGDVTLELAGVTSVSVGFARFSLFDRTEIRTRAKETDEG